MADFSVALRLDPKNATAYNSRGLAYRKTGDLEKAIADYSAAIQLNPIYALAYNNRGYVYEARGDKQAAAADFHRALSLDPALVGAKNGLQRLGEPAAVGAESDMLVAQGKGAGRVQLRLVPCDWPYRRQPQPAGAALARSL